jgi:hypothetical protein
MDGKTAADRYSDYFGVPARDWAFPPLTHLARLYPLEIEDQEHETRVLRSPLHVEADGSFRMHTAVAQGSIGHLMIGSPDLCIEAARTAARKALEGIGSARPIFALVFADVAWQMLLATQPGAEISAVREILGKEIPLVGAYTLGQLCTKSDRMLNQHLLVALFGETID